MTAAASKKQIPSLDFDWIANEVPVSIVIYDRNTLECLFINKQAHIALQLQNSEAITLDKAIPLRPRLNATNLSKEILLGEGSYNEIYLSNFAGRPMVCSASIRPYPSNSSWNVMTFSDISQQKILQRDAEMKQKGLEDALNELLKKNEELKLLDIAKDRFISIVTHELRTPLTAIMASAEILVSHLYQTEADLAMLHNTLFMQSESMMHLVNDILDYAKIQAGKMDFHITKSNPVGMIENSISAFADMAKKNSVTIMPLDLHSTDTECYLDLVRGAQVINNVISNAIKFNKKDGKVFIAIENMAAFLRVSIRDEGVGIPEDKMKEVFDEFVTLGNLNQHHKGTGLGMPISLKIMQAMGGRIYCDSTPGEGTTFFVEFPMSRVLDDRFYNPRGSTGGNLLE